MTDTFNYFGDNARYSDTDDGVVLAVDVNGTRVSASAWTLAKKLHASGKGGLFSGDVSVTDCAMLKSAGVAIRTDQFGTRVFLDGGKPQASRFVIHAPQGNAEKHSGVGVRGNISEPRYGR